MVFSIVPIGLIILAILLIFTFGKFIKVKGSINEELLNSGGIILDVRSAEEFEKDHLEGAVNIPLQDIYNLKEEEIEKLIPDKDKRILIYCRSGRKSEEAVSILKNLDYKDVHNLGGIEM